MFSYRIIIEGPYVQVLHGENVFDECGPWENLTAAIHWAESYVNLKNSGIQEPEFN